MTDLWTVVVILGLAGVTVLARCFFFISSKPWPLPRWAERGLQYARLFAAAAGAMAYFLRRDVLMTIIAGMAVYLPLHLGLGW